jgi:hypothetical protein
LKSDIIFEDKNNYLQIKYYGYNNVEIFFNSLEKAFKICKEKNYPNLVLDILNVDFGKITFTDKYDAGEKIAELFSYPRKVAVLAPKKFHDRLAENVATNRGANIKAFHDINDAIKWIIE